MWNSELKWLTSSKPPHEQGDLAGETAGHKNRKYERTTKLGSLSLNAWDAKKLNEFDTNFFLNRDQLWLLVWKIIVWRKKRPNDPVSPTYILAEKS